MVTLGIELFACPRTVTSRKSTVALAIGLTVIPFSYTPSLMVTTLGYKPRHLDGATWTIELMSIAAALNVAPATKVEAKMASAECLESMVRPPRGGWTIGCE